jgi:hypothetical protein
MLEVQNMRFCSAFQGLIDKSGAMKGLFVEAKAGDGNCHIFPLKF